MDAVVSADVGVRMLAPDDEQERRSRLPLFDEPHSLRARRR
jgi:hypothetical protein